MDEISLSAIVAETIADLPYAVAYFATTLLVYVLGLAAYIAAAPIPEFRLVGQGNIAAACSLAGAMVSLALPLTTVVATTGSMLDLLVWSIAALLVQLITLAVLRRLLPDLNRNVVAGQLASGIFLAALGIAVGVICAGAFLLF